MSDDNDDLERKITEIGNEILGIMRLPERIKERMAVLGLNPFSAAKKAGLGDDYVRDILRGRVKHPSADRLGKLAEALETSLPYLLGREEGVKLVSHTPEGGAEELPAPPAPLPIWDDGGRPAPNLLPIRFELMADAFRPAQDVARAPIGYEATTIPPAVGNRHVWWEIMRDNSMSAVAPEGSLVLVTEWDDSERDKIEHGDFVIVQKRLVGPDSAFHLVSRSMRRVNYRYRDLGLWFLDYASGDPEQDQTDDVWRETEPTEPRRSLAEIAEEIEDPEERARAHQRNKELQEVIETARARAAQPDADRDRRLQEAFDNLPEIVERHQKWRPRLVGKVIRVLTPLDPKAGFGMKTWWG